MRPTTKVRCPECGRVFDLIDEADSREWAFGHDCEAEEKPAPVGDPWAARMIALRYPTTTERN